MKIAKCDAYRVEGQLFETAKQAEDYLKELAIIKAWDSTLPRIAPQIMGVVLGLMRTAVDRTNFRLLLDKLDVIDGISPRAKQIVMKKS